MKTIRRLGWAAIAAFALPANAAIIYNNPITGTNPNTANPYTAGDVVVANLSASGIGRGAGATGTNANDRYNANSWNTTTLDATAYVDWTLTPANGFAIDFTSLTGAWQRSSTGPSSFTLRSSLDGFGADITSGTIGGSGSSAPYNIDLSAAAFNSVVSPITFRMYAYGTTNSGGTFSVNDFSFDGAISAVATGNNSVITAPASATFGRTILGQTPSLNVNLSKSGSDATTYAAVPNNGGLVATSDGAIAGGNQNEAVSVQLQNNANGAATTGPKSYSLSVDNTAATSAAAGQGSADPNDTVTISATVVANRILAASAVDLGNVIVGATTADQLSTISTSGDDNANTRVSVAGTSATDGVATVAAGAGYLFNEASDTTGRTVSATFGSAGAKAGSVPLAVAGEGLVGESVGGVAVAYTANVFDPSSAAFLSNAGTTLTIDFGTFVQGSGIHSLADAIYNVIQTAGYTAALDFDSIAGSGDTGVLFTDLANGEFVNLAAGAQDATSFLASFDANNAPGAYSATYALGLSDADGYAGASAAGSQQLTLELVGTVAVPEPTVAILTVFGSVGLAGIRRRVR